MGSSGWNKPSANQPTVKKGGGKPNLGKGILAGLVVCVGALVAFYFLSGDDADVKVKRRAKSEKSVSVKESAPVKVSQEDKDEARKQEILKEFDSTVREYLKKPMTNNVIVLGPAPLDPKDPDNIFRTRVAQDIAGLLAIEPGEPVPPVIPFYFMFEDDERKACESEGREFKGDGGNADFLDSLKKWKVTIKEGDNEERIAAKENLLQGHIELLKNMDEGMSVNDTIRAAYEFRIKAAEMRKSITEAIKEVYDADQDVEAAKAMIAEMDKKLQAEGIKAIEPTDVFGEESVEVQEPQEAEAEANAAGGM